MEDIFNSSDKKPGIISAAKLLASVSDKDSYEFSDRKFYEKNSAFTPTAKKNSIQSDQMSSLGSDFMNSGGKNPNKRLIQSYIDDFASVEELERVMEDSMEDISIHLDANLLIDLTSKLNIGKEIISETVDMLIELSKLEAILSKEDFSNCPEASKILSQSISKSENLFGQIKQQKLLVKQEEGIIKSLVGIGQLLKKIMAANYQCRKNRLKPVVELDFNSRLYEFFKSGCQIESSIEQSILDGFTVELINLLECTNMIQTDLILRNNKNLPSRSGVKQLLQKILKTIEDCISCARWMCKAREIVESEKTMSIQLTYNKFSEIIKNGGSFSQKGIVKRAIDVLKDMESRFLVYVMDYEQVESQLDEKKIAQLTAEQLTSLQAILTSLSKKYIQVPYCMKLQLKQKQQLLEKIVDSIQWSAAAKGILEKRVDSLVELENILEEQQQKLLQPSQKLLIQDINMRISEVKRANSQLQQIKLRLKQQQLQAMNNPDGKSRPNDSLFIKPRQLSVSIFIELSDTFKDLNQYINLDKQISDVELFLKEYQEQEMKLLKLSKNWTHKFNDYKIDLNAFQQDITLLKNIISQSIFEWSKYQSQVQGLEMVHKVREILSEGKRGSLTLTMALDLKKEMHEMEENENYIIKQFELKKDFYKQVREAQQIKNELENKKIISVERLDQMISELSYSCIFNQQEKYRVAKMKQMKDKILQEVKQIEEITNNKEKVDILKISEILSTIKLSSLDIQPAGAMLERKLHIATQLSRSAKSAFKYCEIQKLIEQYQNQSVKISQIEEIIVENKAVDERINELEWKLKYCWEDCEDVVELMQILNEMKPCFQGKDKIQLLRHKALVLICICMWKNWKSKKPLIGMTHQTLQQILSSLKELDDNFHKFKNTIEKLRLFNSFNSPLKGSPLSLSKQSEQIQKRCQLLLSVESKERHNEKMDIEEEEEKKSVESKSVKSLDYDDKMQKVIDEVINEEREVKLSILKECKDEIERMWEETIGKVKEIRSMTRLNELEKAENDGDYRVGCLDLMDILIEQKIQLQVKETAAKRIAEEQAKVKEAQLQQYRRQDKNQQGPQFQHKIIKSFNLIGAQKAGYISAGAAALLNRNMKIGDKEKRAENNVNIDEAIELLMEKNNFKILEKRAKIIGKKVLISLLLNPNFVDVDRDLIEKAACFVAKRVCETKSPQQLIDMMLILLEELKRDFYSSEQYRREQFSFQTLITMTRLNYNKLQQLASQRNRSKNEDPNASNKNSLNNSLNNITFNNINTCNNNNNINNNTTNNNISNNNNNNNNNNNTNTNININTNNNNNNITNKSKAVQKSKSKSERQNQMIKVMDQRRYELSKKKIIDHLEFLHLTEGFKNTDFSDPEVKELLRLMQSRETLQQFRKLQSDLRKIGGDKQIQQDIRKEEFKKMVEEEKKKESAGKKSIGNNSSFGKKNDASEEGEFSSEDEEEFVQEMISNHPSVLKYIKGIGKGKTAKSLVDPIKQEEMDGFVEFCLNLLHLRKMKNEGNNCILFNPMEGEKDDDDDNMNNLHCLLAGEYDPEVILEQQKKKYVLYAGEGEFKLSKMNNIVCIIEERETVMKECPALLEEEGRIKQSGECEVKETKEFLLKTYKSSNVLTLFGVIESKPNQNDINSIAQDLKDRDRVATAKWGQSTKLYIFHKKMFERDHNSGKIFKKMSWSNSELGIALVFRPTGYTTEQIKAVPKIKDIVLLEDYEKKVQKELEDKQQENKKPVFKKPLPRYRKDTVLRVYVPINSMDEEIGNGDSSALNVLLRPPKLREKAFLQKQIENEILIQQYKKPSSTKTPVDPKKKQDLEAFFQRRLDGKRTIKPILKQQDDIHLKMKDPNMIQQEAQEAEQMEIQKDMVEIKRSIQFSDVAERSVEREEDDYNDDIAQYSDSVDQGNYDFNYDSSSFQQEQEISDNGSNTSSKISQYGDVTPFKIITSNSSKSKAPMSSISSMSQGSLYFPSLSQDSVSLSSVSPVLSHSSASSVSPGIIAKNRLKLLEFASILEQFKPSTLKPSDDSKDSDISSFHLANTDSQDSFNMNSSPQHQESDSYNIENSLSVSPRNCSNDESNSVSPRNRSPQLFTPKSGKNILIKNKLISKPSYDLSKNKFISEPLKTNSITDSSDGLTTPQLSVSKISYSKEISPSDFSSSALSSNNFSGKRSFSSLFQGYANSKPQKYMKLNSFQRGQQQLNDLNNISDSSKSILTNKQLQSHLLKSSDFEDSEKSSEPFVLEGVSSLEGASSISGQQQISKFEKIFSVSSYDSNSSPFSEFSEEDLNKSTPVLHSFKHNSFENQQHYSRKISSHNAIQRFISQNKPVFGNSRKMENQNQNTNIIEIEEELDELIEDDSPLRQALQTSDMSSQLSQQQQQSSSSSSLFSHSKSFQSKSLVTPIHKKNHVSFNLNQPHQILNNNNHLNQQSSVMVSSDSLSSPLIPPPKIHQVHFQKPISQSSLHRKTGSDRNKFPSSSLKRSVSPINKKPSQFIYEQDNYQFNDKKFIKSIQKLPTSDSSSSDFSDNRSPSEVSSSSASKANSENQLLDLRNQLDSLLSVIQSKKQQMNTNATSSNR